MLKKKEHSYIHNGRRIIVQLNETPEQKWTYAVFVDGQSYEVSPGRVFDTEGIAFRAASEVVVAGLGFSERTKSHAPTAQTIRLAAGLGRAPDDIRTPSDAAAAESSSEPSSDLAPAETYAISLTEGHEPAESLVVTRGKNVPSSVAEPRTNEEDSLPRRGMFASEMIAGDDAPAPRYDAEALTSSGGRRIWPAVLGVVFLALLVVLVARFVRNRGDNHLNQTAPVAAVTPSGSPESVNRANPSGDISSPATRPPIVPAPANPPTSTPPKRSPGEPVTNPSSAGAATASAIPPKVPGHVVLQVGAMRNESNANALVQTLRQKKFPAFIFRNGDNDFYRVAVGPYSSAAAANDAKSAIEAEGMTGIRRRWSPE
jgi:cell division septation protein DedD